MVNQVGSSRRGCDNADVKSELPLVIFTLPASLLGAISGSARYEAFPICGWGGRGSRRLL